MTDSSKKNNTEKSPKSEQTNADAMLQELYKTAVDESKPAAEPPTKTAKSATLRTDSTQITSTRSTSASPSGTNFKPTVLTFQPVVENDGIARCMLVLCNISDVALHFTLKGCHNSSVSASLGDGHVGPHAQLRVLLIWTRPDGFQRWGDAPQPRILLSTNFLDDENKVTYTRLLGRISRTKTCTLANPPVEQLLLDAMGNAAQHQIPLSSSPSQSFDGHAMADFVNNLSDRSFVMLFVFVIIFVMILSGGHRR